MITPCLIPLRKFDDTGRGITLDHRRPIVSIGTALLHREGLWGGGADYAYEALNWVDGKNRVRDIAQALSAEFGPVPEEEVAEFLGVLETIGVLIHDSKASGH